MRKRLYFTIGTVICIVLIIIASIISHNIDSYDTPTHKEKVTTTETTTQVETTTESNVDLSIDVNDELLTLVNYAHPVPDDWEVDLVKVEDDKYIDKRAEAAFKEMLSAARAAGVEPYVRNAYRSRETQQEVFNDKYREYLNSGYSSDKAKELANEWIALPGTSEHELGLAADIVDDHYHKLDEDQEKTDTQKWLMKNSYKYGFILRYPTDKKDITHVNYEPWHYRYVGKENAEKIYKSGLCLEEYLALAEVE